MRLYYPNRLAIYFIAKLKCLSTCNITISFHSCSLNKDAIMYYFGAKGFFTRIVMIANVLIKGILISGF
jgi:hypothetical protein